MPGNMVDSGTPVQVVRGKLVAENRRRVGGVASFWVCHYLTVPRRVSKCYIKKDFIRARYVQVAGL
jgi:hypothetical protein